MSFRKGLPHTDEGIAAIFHGIANRQCLKFTWDGANTILTDQLVEAFTNHAKMYWFERPPESFGIRTGETVFALIGRLRTLEKEQLAAT